MPLRRLSCLLLFFLIGCLAPSQRREIRNEPCPGKRMLHVWQVYTGNLQQSIAKQGRQTKSNWCCLAAFLSRDSAAAVKRLGLTSRSLGQDIQNQVYQTGSNVLRLAHQVQSDSVQGGERLAQAYHALAKEVQTQWQADRQALARLPSQWSRYCANCLAHWRQAGIWLGKHTQQQVDAMLGHLAYTSAWFRRDWQKGVAAWERDFRSLVVDLAQQTSNCGQQLILLGGTVSRESCQGLRALAQAGTVLLHTTWQQTCQTATHLANVPTWLRTCWQTGVTAWHLAAHALLADTHKQTQRLAQTVRSLGQTIKQDTRNGLLEIWRLLHYLITH